MNKVYLRKKAFTNPKPPSSSVHFAMSSKPSMEETDEANLVDINEENLHSESGSVAKYGTKFLENFNEFGG